jgi:hypothetical protein
MGSKRARFSDQIRKAVNECGVTRYRLAKLSGISESRFSKFMAGAGLSLEALDTLAETLGLSVLREKQTPNAVIEKGSVKR